MKIVIITILKCSASKQMAKTYCLVKVHNVCWFYRLLLINAMAHTVNEFTTEYQDEKDHTRRGFKGQTAGNLFTEVELLFQLNVCTTLMTMSPLYPCGPKHHRQVKGAQETRDPRSQCMHRCVHIFPFRTNMIFIQSEIVLFYFFKKSFELSVQIL